MSEEPRAQQDMFASGGSGSADGKPRRPLSELRSGRSLERLRDRIQLAARELRRLREENAALQHRLDELQARGPGAVEGTPVVFTESASVLRNRIEGFIESIDQYLERTGDAAPREAT